MSLTHCDQCRISSHRCEPSPPNRARRKEITGIESLSTICSTISSDFVNHKATMSGCPFNNQLVKSDQLVIWWLSVWREFVIYILAFHSRTKLQGYYWLLLRAMFLKKKECVSDKQYGGGSKSGAHTGKGPRSFGSSEPLLLCCTGILSLGSSCSEEYVFQWDRSKILASVWHIFPTFTKFQKS